MLVPPTCDVTVTSLDSRDRPCHPARLTLWAHHVRPILAARARLTRDMIAIDIATPDRDLDTVLGFTRVRVGHRGVQWIAGYPPTAYTNEVPWAELLAADPRVRLAAQWRAWGLDAYADAILGERGVEDVVERYAWERLATAALDVLAAVDVAWAHRAALACATQVEEAAALLGVPDASLTDLLADIRRYSGLAGPTRASAAAVLAATVNAVGAGPVGVARDAMLCRGLRREVSPEDLRARLRRDLGVGAIE